MQRDEHFIPLDDGYTEPGFIAAVPGLHGAVSFSYRPMTHAARNVINGALAKKDGTAGSDLIAQALVRQVKVWSLTKPVVKASCLALRPALVEKIYAIVAGYAASDARPDAPGGSTDSEAELEAMLAGTDPGTARAEAAAKN